MASKTAQKPAAKKAATKPAPRKATAKTPPRLDPKLAARVVKLRDEDGKAWKEIEAATKRTPGQLRRLYNAGRKEANA